MAGMDRMPWIINAVKRGLSANAGLEELRAAGQGMRRADYLALYGEVRSALESRITGIDRPGGRRPYVSEILVYSTAVETGYMQYVDVWVKHRETGEIYPRPYGLRTDDLLTHDDAIATAIDRYSGYTKIYGETILGATYMATYALIPREIA